MDISKKTALRILTLYVLTSFIFLTLVFYGWYATKRDFIIKSHINGMRDLTHTLMVYLYESSQETQKEAHAIIQTEIPFMLVKGNGEILLSTLKHIETPKQVQEILDTQEWIQSHKHRNIREKVIQTNDGLYYITQRLGGRFWHLIQQNFARALLRGDEVFLVVYSKGFQSELNALLGVIFVSFFAALLAISIIAYFLVLLSLEPLREKITHLNAFIKDSTHEINTPISVILMSIERISPQTLDSKQIQKFERIKLAAKTLEQIYQDLLFYTFEEAKDSKLEEIHLATLIKERLEYFKPFFTQKNIAITFNIIENTESHLKANTSRIVRVVDNLLDNALKYTQNGGCVTITLGERFLSIQDNGCGIAKEHLDKIFTRYYRANSNQGGFGIGLTLAKQICTLYGISLACHSILGKGSTFTLKW